MTFDPLKVQRFHVHDSEIMPDTVPANGYSRMVMEIDYDDLLKLYEESQNSLIDMCTLAHKYQNQFWTDDKERLSR